MPVESVSDCTECFEKEREHYRFIARGAVWCSHCDSETPETIAARRDVQK